MLAGVFGFAARWFALAPGDRHGHSYSAGGGGDVGTPAVTGCAACPGAVW